MNVRFEPLSLNGSDHRFAEIPINTALKHEDAISKPAEAFNVDIIHGNSAASGSGKQWVPDTPPSRPQPATVSSDLG